MSIGTVLDTIIIGGGQAGLAAGYFLARQGQAFVILDECKRGGEAWRSRWDSLRLFTPSKYNSLPGMRFPMPDFYFPTKDEVADYLQAYEAKFDLPVHHGVRAEALAPSGSGYRVVTSAGSLEARHVIVATGAYQRPYIPGFAGDLDPTILQLHSSAYCNPLQIPGRRVLVVGAGNSGAELAIELARAGKQVWMAGRDVGRIPADKIGPLLGGRPYWFFISRVLSVDTPIGRKMMADILHRGAPLIGTSRREVAAAGVESVSRVARAAAGRLQLEDGRSLEVDAVIWATGFRPDYKWIDLPVFDEHGYPRHRLGMVAESPGLYFVGLPFQKSLSSALLGGVGRDAEVITAQLAQAG